MSSDLSAEEQDILVVGWHHCLENYKEEMMTGEMVLLTWAAFLLTTLLSLLPNETTGLSYHLLRILLASLIGYVAWALLTYLWRNAVEIRPKSILRQVAWKIIFALLPITKILAAVIAGGVFIYFKNYFPVVQDGIAAFLGFIAIWMVFTWEAKRQRWGRVQKSYTGDTIKPLYGWIFVATWVVFTSAVGSAAAFGSLVDIAQAGVIVLLGTFALYFTLLTLTLLLRGQPVQIEGHWGGLGGGLGGWRISRPLVFLLLAVFFGGATATLTMRSKPPQITYQDKSGQDKSQQVPTAAVQSISTSEVTESSKDKAAGAETAPNPSAVTVSAGATATAPDELEQEE